MCRDPEPDEFKVDATYTSRVTHTKMGIHSKYTEHIHKFKYRQGIRPAGEHPRARASINNLNLEGKAPVAKKTQFICIAVLVA